MDLAKKSSVRDFIIRSADYRKRRKLKDFLLWIDTWLNDQITPAACQEFFLRKAKYDKKMYEEAMPVMLYLRKYFKDQLETFDIELSEDNDNYDATIYETSGLLFENVEVTSPPKRDEHITRRKIATTGLSRYAMMKPRETIAEYTSTVSFTVKKKLIKSYPQPTVLLVPLSCDMILEEKSRFTDVCSRVTRAVGSVHPFKKIVLIERVGNFCKVLK